MASVSEICGQIVEKVIESNLDYKMNQTPYSIYFSIRKKYIKNVKEEPTRHGIQKSENFKDLSVLNQDLNYLKWEYEKLFNLYQDDQKAKSNLAEALERAENAGEKLKLNQKDLNLKYENKCLEVKKLKSDIEQLERGKNELSVDLKFRKQELKEQSTSYVKKTKNLEKKLKDLENFKTKKIAEERVVKIEKKRELKKVKKKMKTDKVVEPGSGESTEEEVEEDFIINVPLSNLFETLASESTKLPSITSSTCSTSESVSSKSIENNPTSKQDKIEPPDPITNTNPSTSPILTTPTDKPNPKVSTDQAVKKSDEEFKAEVTDMIRKYKENRDCSIS